MKSRRWLIYCVTHVASGRVYIGQTVKSLATRWSQHVRAAERAGIRFYFANAIRSYGPDAFTRRVLEECDSQEDANDAEDAWIESFAARDPRYGFNRKRGGNEGPHFITRNPWHREGVRERLLASLNAPDARRRMSEASIRAKSSPAVRAKVSAEASARWSDPAAREKQVRAMTAAQRAARAADPTIVRRAAVSRKVTMARKRAERTTFMCKRHGDMPLAECYRKMRAGVPVYACRQCIRDRSGSVPRGTPEHRARLSQAVTAAAARARAEKSTFRCKRHGRQPLAAGYTRVDPKTGHVQYRCKVCALATNRRSAARRVADDDSTRRAARDDPGSAE